MLYDFIMLGVVVACLAAIHLAFEEWNEGLWCPRLAENGLWPAPRDLLATKRRF